MKAIKLKVGVLLLTLCCITSTGWTQTRQSLKRNKKGKYIYRSTNKVYPILTNSYPNQKYWIVTDIVPVGAWVTLRHHLDSPFRVQVIDSLKAPYTKTKRAYPYAYLSPATLKALKLASHGGLITLEYQTPLDSLLKNVAQSTFSEQFIGYQKLALQFLKYHAHSTETPPLDSLEKMSARFSDKQKVDYRFFLARFLKKNQPMKAKKLFESLAKTAQAQGDKTMEAACWLHIGDIEVEWFRQRDWRKLSPRAYLTYLKIAKSQQQNRKIAIAYKRIGDLYLVKRATSKAESYYLKLLKMREQENDLEKQAWVWGALIQIYNNVGWWAKSEYYLLKLVDYRRNKGTTQELLWSLSELMWVYNNLEKMHKSLRYLKEMYALKKDIGLLGLLEKYDGADFLDYLLTWFKEEKQDASLKNMLAQRITSLTFLSRPLIAAKYMTYQLDFIDDPLATWTTLNDIAFSYHKMGKYALGKQFYTKGLRFAIRHKKPIWQAIQYHKLAYFYHGFERFRRVKKYYRKALKVLKNSHPDAYKNNGGLYHIKYMFGFLVTQPQYRELAVALAKQFVRLSEGTQDQSDFQQILKALQAN